MASPVLWHNGEQAWDVCLLDVPRSISAAQGTAAYPCSDTLLSSEPIACPFPSNEPKSAAARAKLLYNTVGVNFHVQYSTILHGALEQVRQYHQGAWCLPRPFTIDTRGRSRKRKADEDASSSLDLVRATSPKLPDGVSFYVSGSQPGEELHAKSTDSEGDEIVYRVPPCSTFSLSDCSTSRSFLSSIRNQAQDESAKRHFDLVLLDPPWPNRSVKRSHKTPGSSYTTCTTLDDTFRLLMSTDLDMVMADDCLVGIWITNKPAVRELVCGDGGILDTWGLKLEEEWIWLKTTVNGEPLSAIDSLWRKPYEVLLLGRKRPSGLFAPSQSAVKRRTIISVPDLHSRKPCLKLLLEPMMSNVQSYRALEVFARHLVSGWWSWGNECIKFNESQHWHAQGVGTD